ncbi:YegP family protein [Arcobacter sp. LA11]|uniref:YegP family protein n=1 Tax=Arcobacter sp. LA11 TaxID=1898176 RepID=UPI000934A0EC|nr:YegP family protein [Arcobacter sp. LA11]
MTINLRKSDAKEPFTFVFVNAEGKTIVKSENYAQKASAKNGIESVKKNCQDDDRYELKESSNGKPFFNIKSTNGQIVGTSALFADEAERSAAIAELKADSAEAEVSE